MRRGDIYLVQGGQTRDPKKQRPYLVVSRQALLDSRFSSAICAPVYSEIGGLTTEVPVGVDEGLKKDSCVRCDELISVEKSRLMNYVGSLPMRRWPELDFALMAALQIEMAGVFPV